jgi:hypothetical protein
MRSRFLQFFALSFLMLLTACPELVSVPTLGNLDIVVSGVPKGTISQITVSGPEGFSRSITSSERFTGLKPGEYQVTGLGVTVEKITYLSSNHAFQVLAGQTTTAQVQYVAQLGNLQVNLSGLPTGVSGLIEITNSNGFAQMLTSSQKLENLPSGGYSVHSNVVIANNITYAPSESNTAANIFTNETAELNIRYIPLVGKLEITVQGLPVGTLVDMTVTGPSNFSQNLTAAQTIDMLPIGNYSLSARDVTIDGQVYKAAISGIPGVIVVGGITQIQVIYSTNLGALEITVTGLLNGAGADFGLQGPVVQTVHVIGTKLVTNLPEGDYFVGFPSFEVDGVRYTEKIGIPRPWNVKAGQTTLITVDYIAHYGRVKVEITGLPSGVNADISLSGNNTTERHLTTSATITVPDGDYFIRPNEVISSGVHYRAQELGSNLTVPFNQEVSASFTYIAQAGSLTVNINGLPTNIPDGLKDHHVLISGSYGTSVDGNGWFSEWLDITKIFTTPIGTYSIRAYTASDCSKDVYFDPNQQSWDNIQIDPGSNQIVTVNYASSLKYGTIEVSIGVEQIPTGADLTKIYDFKINTPNGSFLYQASAISSAVFCSSEIGPYSVTAPEITLAGIVYRPVIPVPSDPPTVTSNHRTKLPILYIKI